MIASQQERGRSKATKFGVLFAAAMLGCATTSSEKSAALPVAPEVTAVAKRPVQAVRLEPSQVDGQTSWIIEPDVPRIPKIHGLERQLPPHIDQRLSRAFDLAQRGATYSANIEFLEVISLCALELDARQGATSHRDALRQGLIALDEADEISGHRIDWSDAADVRMATAGHSTPVLRGDVPPGADAIQAVQLYYSYAEERLAYACQGLPGASLAYYGLARTYVQSGTRYAHAAGKSAMLQRVALRVAPQNVLAANELGVLLAQHGHLDEAESLFKQCVAANASPEAWQNLAAVHARKGDLESSRAALAEAGKLVARQQAANAKAESPSTESPVPPVSALPPESLATSNTTSEPNTADNTNQSGKDRGGFWKRLELSRKFQDVFRR